MNAGEVQLEGALIYSDKEAARAALVGVEYVSRGLLVLLQLLFRRQSIKAVVTL